LAGVKIEATPGVGNAQRKGLELTGRRYAAERARNTARAEVRGGAGQKGARQGAGDVPSPGLQSRVIERGLAV